MLPPPIFDRNLTTHPNCSSALFDNSRPQLVLYDQYPTFEGTTLPPITLCDDVGFRRFFSHGKRPVPDSNQDDDLTSFSLRPAKIPLTHSRPSLKDRSSPLLVPASPPASPQDTPMCVSPTESCCLLCAGPPPDCLAQNGIWSNIVRVALFCLVNGPREHTSSSDKFCMLKTDIYPYILQHWDVLCPEKTKSEAGWHKQVQDALSHNRDLFESGLSQYKQYGYWRLRETEDPWLICASAFRKGGRRGFR